MMLVDNDSLELQAVILKYELKLKEGPGILKTKRHYQMMGAKLAGGCDGCFIHTWQHLIVRSIYRSRIYSNFDLRG